MRDEDGTLSFTPRLPSELTRLAFRICFRGRKLLVEVKHGVATYSLLDGDTIELVHHGERVTTQLRATAERSDPASAGARSANPAGRARPGRRSATK